MNTQTLDLYEDMDGDFYVCPDMGECLLLTDLIILELDEINNTVTISI